MSRTAKAVVFSAVAAAAQHRGGRLRRAESPSAPERTSALRGRRLRPSRDEAQQRQSLTQVLPNAGFSRPMTLTVLPQTLTGM